MRGRRTDGGAEWRTVITGLLGGVRRIAGMPDYTAHVEHLRSCHPERPIPTQRQFYEEYLKLRYEQGPTRCC